MTITVQQFRADFTEFGSTSTFPNSAVQFWLNVAYQMLDASRWLDQLDLAAELFAAHNIVLEARAQKEAANGGIPGQQTGPLNSKSVDKVSLGFDTGSAIEENAGHWNLTVYGTRLFQLIRMFGAGPIHIGVGAVPTGSGLAWSGPYVGPGFTNFG